MPATVADLRGYHEAVSGATDIKLATILDTARWEIEEFAPKPDTTDAAKLLDYDDRLINAQLRISAYLFDTGGYRSSTGSLGKLGSKSFDAQGRAVYEGARRTMGPFVLEEGAMAYVESIPK